MRSRPRVKCRPPRPDAVGDPDLQGIWVGSTLTPLERPPQFEGWEFLTAEEVAALEDGAVARNVRLAESGSGRSARLDGGAPT